MRRHQHQHRRDEGHEAAHRQPSGAAGLPQAMAMTADSASAADQSASAAN
jgi:hypothetical protein